MAKKKSKPKYNQNSQIRSAIRRTFSRSPLVQEVLQDARIELLPKLKKDGTPSKRNQIRYKCASCSKLFMKKDIAADHINPVIPLKGAFKNWNIFVKRLFCKKSNLQVLCSYYLKDIGKHGNIKSCHHKKTAEERVIRKEYEKAITQ